MDNDTLQFQDFSDKSGLLSDESGFAAQAGEDKASKSHSSSDEVNPNNLNDADSRPEERRARCYEFEYWQRFFDVDSREVAERLWRSFIPTRKHTFGDMLSSKPDFYGPFWASVTLIFLLGLSANVRSYFHPASELNPNRTDINQYNSDAAAEYSFEYNFQLVPVALGVISGYFILVGLLETVAIGCLKLSVQLDFATLACAHGYALVVFNVVAIVWLVNNVFFAWIMTLSSATLSAAPLLRTLLVAFQKSPSETVANTANSEENSVNVSVDDGLNDAAANSASSRLSRTSVTLRQFAVPITVVSVLGLHFLLAVSFMLVFYY